MRDVGLDWRNPKQLWAAFLFAAAIAITATAYAPGLGGTLHFDDPHNLNGLKRVLNGAPAAQFIMNGAAGLFGRPIAYASFVPQAYAWPDAPAVLLHTNICLHLLNGALVVWLMYLLCTTRREFVEKAAPVAVAVGSIWMLMPILASSSLMIVQRMTVLSASFVLLGLIGYLYSRRHLEWRPKVALVLMSSCLVIFTALAMLTKENGALLPLYIMAAEFTILPAVALDAVNRKWYRRWCAVFLVAPTVVILGYLALRFQYDPSTLAKRDFNAAQRLLTEGRILWEYLYHAFLPATSDFRPFHDSYPVTRSLLEPISLLAVSGWALAISSAAVLRKRAPLFAFAVAWYLVGHCLESTTIPLELYFEHRNYLPLIGPVFALGMAASKVPVDKYIGRAAFAAYGISLAVVLFNTTSLWGRPALAAEMWAIHDPDSKRATQYLAKQYEQRGDYTTARRVIRSYEENNSESVGMTLQILALSCVIEPHSSHVDLISRVREKLRTAPFEYGLFEVLRNLYRAAADDRCEALGRDTVYGLATIAASNPAFQANSTMHHNLHILMFEEAFARRDLGLAMKHLEAALDAQYTISTLELAVRTLNSAGLFNDADRFLERARTHEPTHPGRAVLWRQEIANLQEIVDSYR